MTYPYRLVLTDGVYTFNTFDYGRSIPYKLYDPTDAAFDASTYTGYIKLFDAETGGEVINETASNANASGVGSFAFTSTNRIGVNKAYILEWQGEKSGRVESFRCIHPISFYTSPAGSRTP